MTSVHTGLSLRGSSAPAREPWVAAKHRLEGLSDVMRLELRHLGIQVAIIEPGFVGTAVGGKLQRDTADAISALPDEGRRCYGPALEKVAEEISHQAETGSPPEVVAEDVLHALTSKTPRTRYPSGPGAKRMLFMRRVLPDRQFDWIILRAGGLKGF